MGQCGITSSKTVLVFLNLIFWVSPGGGWGRSGSPGAGLPLPQPRGEGRARAGRGVEPGPEGAAAPGRAASPLSAPRSRTAAGGSHTAPRRRFGLCLKAFCLTGALCPFAGPRALAVGAVPSLPVHTHTPHPQSWEVGEARSVALIAWQ